MTEPAYIPPKPGLFLQGFHEVSMAKGDAPAGSGIYEIASMGELVQLNEYRLKLAQGKRAETLQQARDLVQNASLLLAGLDEDCRRVAWLLEDSLRLIENGDSRNLFPSFPEEMQVTS